MLKNIKNNRTRWSSRTLLGFINVVVKEPSLVYHRGVKEVFLGLLILHEKMKV